MLTQNKTNVDRWIRLLWIIEETSRSESLKATSQFNCESLEVTVVLSQDIDHTFCLFCSFTCLFFRPDKLFRPLPLLILCKPNNFSWPDLEAQTRRKRPDWFKDLHSTISDPVLVLSKTSRFLGNDRQSLLTVHYFSNKDEEIAGLFDCSGAGRAEENSCLRVDCGNVAFTKTGCVQDGGGLDLAIVKPKRKTTNPTSGRERITTQRQTETKHSPENVTPALTQCEGCSGRTWGRDHRENSKVKENPVEVAALGVERRS